MTGAELAPAGAGSAWEIRKRRLGLPVEAEEALSSRASLRTVLRGQLECVMETNSVSYLSIDWGVGSFESTYTVLYIPQRTRGLEIEWCGWKCDC
jgi:hypothetical protein